MRCHRGALFLGVVSQFSALECGDVDTMMLNSLDEEPMCSVSLLQHRAAPKRKSRAVDVEFSSGDASEDASLAVQELSDAIGKLVSAETASESTGTFRDDKDESLHRTHGPLHVHSEIKEQAQQEASHALKAMQGAFTELFSQRGAGKVVDGTIKHSASNGHRFHHKGVVLTQMSVSESLPPPLVFSWEGSPLTSDFEDASALAADESSHGNQTSEKIAELTAKVNESINETQQSQNGKETAETSNSTDSLDTPLMNDTVYVEASSSTVANATNAQKDTGSIVANSSSVNASQVDVVEDTHGTATVNNSTTLVANQTIRADNDAIATEGVSGSVSNQTVGSNASIPAAVEDIDGTAKAGSGMRSIMNQTREAVNQSIGGAVEGSVDSAEASNNTRLVANKTVEMDGDEIAMPVFVFNGTKLAEDANLDVAPEVPRSSLYSIPSDIALDMDKVTQDMDHLLNNWVEDVGVGGSITGLAQVDDKFEKLSARVVKDEIAGESSHAVSDMSIKLASLQSALAQMDFAELSL